jgi:hydroxyacyl-ACP dehydratase HTD2-like protein with hotdog domain
VIRALRTPAGVEVDLGWVEVGPSLVQRYHAAVGADLIEPAATDRVPLGLALSLRGGPLPPVELHDGTVSLHGGHALRAHSRLAVPGRYRVRTRIDSVFEKSGRSGPLTVIARSASLCDARGAVIVDIEDQQIVRWRPPAGIDRSGAGPTLREPARPRETGGDDHTGRAPLDLGSVIAVEPRLAPDGAAVRRYAELLADGEPMFADHRAARALGFADVIVPGPLQAALLEDLLSRHLPDWEVTALAFTFRISLIAAEPITLSVTVTESGEAPDARYLGVEFTIENAQLERATLGSATLRR